MPLHSLAAPNTRGGYSGSKAQICYRLLPVPERDGHQVTALAIHSLNGASRAITISLDSKRTKANIPEQLAMNTPL
ncbi:hypothetical protein AERO8C_60034 [Aeromonas veronii]|uniref:Uncharacterized protein n=1 Tax=Aeromonas veronii TaxID=654 RepID=A0A653LAC8_AERVE|nr:hypothetical protein AERO8C_60034 [Aeromonas veronii]